MHVVAAAGTVHNEERLPSADTYLTMVSVENSRRRILDELGVPTHKAFPIPDDCTHLLAPPGCKRLTGCLPSYSAVGAADVPTFDRTAGFWTVRFVLVGYHGAGYTISVYAATVKETDGPWHVTHMEMIRHYE